MDSLLRSTKFNVKDLDAKALYERAYREAILIDGNPSQAKGRSLEEIIVTCMYGQAAELFMLTQGFADDLRAYKDVIRPDGVPSEVKVTEHEGNVPYVLQRCNAAAAEAWRKYSPMLYIWINDKKSYDYRLYGMYEWNGKEFILQ